QGRAMQRAVTRCPFFRQCVRLANGHGIAQVYVAREANPQKLEQCRDRSLVIGAYLFVGYSPRFELVPGKKLRPGFFFDADALETMCDLIGVELRLGDRSFAVGNFPQTSLLSARVGYSLE